MAASGRSCSWLVAYTWGRRVRCSEDGLASEHCWTTTGSQESKRPTLGQCGRCSWQWEAAWPGSGVLFAPHGLDIWKCASVYQVNYHRPGASPGGVSRDDSTDPSRSCTVCVCTVLGVCMRQKTGCALIICPGGLRRWSASPLQYQLQAVRGALCGLCVSSV